MLFAIMLRSLNLLIFSCIKLIPKKKQALVEFDDIESAKNLVESSQVLYVVNV